MAETKGKPVKIHACSVLCTLHRERNSTKNVLKAIHFFSKAKPKGKTKTLNKDTTLKSMCTHAKVSLPLTPAKHAHATNLQLCNNLLTNTDAKKDPMPKHEVNKWSNIMPGAVVSLKGSPHISCQVIMEGTALSPRLTRVKHCLNIPNCVSHKQDFQ